MSGRHDRGAVVVRCCALAFISFALSCGVEQSAPLHRAAQIELAAPLPPADLIGAAPRLDEVPIPADTTALGSRLVPRELPIPRVGPGRTARFVFDGARRGFFVRVPEEQRMHLLTPTYGRGRLYVGGGFESSALYGINARTGSIEWAAQAPDGGPTAAIIEGDKVLFNTESCTLFVVDAETGELRWSRWLGDPLMGQPAVGGGRVFSAHVSDTQTGFGGAAGGFRMSALDLDDGHPLWSRRITGDVMNAPVLDDENVYFTTMDGVVWRLAQSDGRVVWRERLRASSAPWLDGESVHVARREVIRNTEGASTRVERSTVLAKSSGEIVREHDPVPAAFVRARPDGGGVESGWAYEGSRPTIVEGRLYQTIGDEVQCRDAETGELLWRRRYVEHAHGRPASPPAVAGAQLVFGTADGVLYGLDIDTGMTTWAYDVGEPIAAQPTVAHGWVYASTTRGGVVGLEVADSSLDGWPMWGGNAAHNGPVAPSDPPEEEDERPSEGTLRLFTDPRSGELAGFPLRDTRVHARVSGFVARVEVEQTFENPYDRAVEAVYLFPLPEDSAVDAMELRTGTRVVHGQIREREQARREYRRARDRGVLASLLEQERPNLFRQTIANIRPGEGVRVVLRYTEVVPYEEGSYRFVFPMVAGPRYTPEVTDQAPSDVAQVVLPSGERRDRVEVSIDADFGTEIREVTSPTHSITVSRASATRTSVALSSRPDRDLDVRFLVAGEAPSVGFLASPPRSDERGFLSLVVHPRLEVPDAEVAPRELCFVVDTSSSMLGAPMELARAAVLRALDGLRPDDTFRIVRFSDRTSELDAAPLPATPENVERARRFVRGLVAHGTTEMTRGLHAALAADADPTHMRIVLLLTDGYIGNETDVFREVDSSLGLARVFAFGVGSAVNRYLLTRVTELGRGDVQVVTPSESPAEAADKFHERIAKPYLTDVRIDWGGLPVEDAYPRRVPDLFADRPIVVHARYTHAARGEVTVRGRIAGREFEQVVRVSLPERGRERVELESIWARTRISDLMNAMALRPNDALRDEVTELGLRYSLLTQWTAFVAIDEGYRVDAPARPTRVDQATEMPSGIETGVVQFHRVSLGAGYAPSVSASYPMLLSAESSGYGLGAGTQAPMIRTGAAEVRGSLSRDVIHRMIVSHMNEVRGIYERALRRNPSIGGRIVVRLVINAEGNVVAGDIVSSTFGDAEVEQAILARVRTWIFPSVEGGDLVEINYPFVFAAAPD